MKTTDTPETDEAVSNAECEEDLIMSMRSLENRMDDAIQEATNAVNDIITVRYQRDRLAEALEEMRHGHTDKAESMAIAALGYLENSLLDNQ